MIEWRRLYMQNRRDRCPAGLLLDTVWARSRFSFCYS